MNSLKLKPSDRQSIDFAEIERVKSQSKGALLHNKEIAIYEIKLTEAMSSVLIEGLEINNQEVLCYDIISGVISVEADLCIQVGSDEGMSTNYHTFGIAHGITDEMHNSSYWKAGYFRRGRFHGHGEIAVIDGDATMLCKGVSVDDSQGGFRNFGGACNLDGENITKINFYLTYDKFPADTYIKLYKKVKAV